MIFELTLLKVMRSMKKQSKHRIQANPTSLKILKDLVAAPPSSTKGQSWPIGMDQIKCLINTSCRFWELDCCCCCCCCFQLCYSSTISSKVKFIIFYLKLLTKFYSTFYGFYIFYDFTELCDGYFSSSAQQKYNTNFKFLLVSILGTLKLNEIFFSRSVFIEHFDAHFIQNYFIYRCSRGASPTNSE